MIELRTRTEGNDLIELLLSCHHRIRRFGATALRMLETPEASDSDIVDAALRVHRYFTVAFPLHVLDEEESIRPRLEKLGGPAVREALSTMSDEHTSADALLERLIPEWEQIAQMPDRARDRAEELIPLTRSLIDELETHLELEEKEIFPHLSGLLDDSELDAIVSELRDRRREAHARTGPAMPTVVSLTSK